MPPHEQPTNGNGWLKRLGEVLDPLVKVGTILAILGGIVFATTGGFKSGNQVALDDLNREVLALTNQITLMQVKIDALPNMAAYADLSAHMARIDGLLSAVADRFTRDEIEAAKISAKVESLKGGTDTPVRTPR
jgi:hypothetical protein